MGLALLSAFGETKLYREWLFDDRKGRGVTIPVLRKRISLGWRPEDAVITDNSHINQERIAVTNGLFVYGYPITPKDWGWIDPAVGVVPPSDPSQYTYYISSDLRCNVHERGGKIVVAKLDSNKWNITYAETVLDAVEVAKRN